MKRILVSAFALFSALSFGATLNPIQLLNPTGSTAGQVISSTGATTAPIWGGVTLGSVTGTLAVNHGGTGVSSASGNALDNITGFAGTGFLKRTGAGTYSFVADPMPIANGGTGQTSASAGLLALGGAPIASPIFTGLLTAPTVASSGSPTSTANATSLTATLYSNYGAGTSGGANNPPAGVTVTAHNYASSTANTSNVRGIFTQAVDHGGNTGLGIAHNNFIEGLRSHATAASGVSYSTADGIISYAAGAVGLPYMYTIGVESQVDNLYANAPTPLTFTAQQFSASFLATTGEPSGTFMPDAGFMTNPNNSSKYQTGFLVADNSANYAAFANRANTAVGIDLALATYSNAPIRIPNNAAIKARNAANSSDLNVFYLDTSNGVHLGAQAAGVTSDVAFNASSTITPSQTAGIVGTTTNNNANAGSFGEYLTGTTSGTSVTTGTQFNATSVSLTAGDWDVTGTIGYLNAAGAIQNAGNASISTTSATQNTAIGNMTTSSATQNTANNQRLSTPVVRLSLSATTTVYLVGSSTFSGGTETADGFIRARRVR